MSDPMSLVAGTLRSSSDLYRTVRKLQSQDKKARALKDELGALNTVLETLLETITNYPEIDLSGLKLPLERCGKVCEEYGQVITQSTKHSDDGSRPSFRDWVRQGYLQGDITDFKDMIASYKATINVALANANIRVVAVTPQLIEEYKDILLDTKTDLKAHLEALEGKVQQLSKTGASGSEGSTDWHAWLEEKETTKQGLAMCTQLSAQIDLYESLSKESFEFESRPSARKHLQSGFKGAKGSLLHVISQLRAHEEELDKQMSEMRSRAPPTETTTTDLSRLQDSRASIRQCIDIVSGASDGLSTEGANVFEDIQLADNSYEFSVSTVGELITARRLTLKDRSRHIAGQISEKNFDESMQALTSLDKEYLRTLRQSGQASESTSDDQKLGKSSSVIPGRFGQYGQGNQLSPSKE